MTRTPQDTFLALIEGVAAGAGETLADLYAPDATVTHPFSPFGAGALHSREELRQHFHTSGGEPAVTRQVADVVVHHTTDPEVVIGEFRYACTVDETGAQFSIRAVFVMRVRDGLIVESRDYLDHLSRLRGYGQLDVLRRTLDELPTP